MDIYTVIISLSATQKHVMTSVSNHKTVKTLAELCYLLAGGEAAFRKSPFLSLNINFIIPPLRLDNEACEVMRESVKYGIPVMANVFGQRGASSPVSVIGSVCQIDSRNIIRLTYMLAFRPELKSHLWSKIHGNGFKDRRYGRWKWRTSSNNLVAQPNDALLQSSKLINCWGIR